MENPKILIIDDERDICTSLKYVLSTKGYIVDVARTAGKGVEKIKKNHFNLVLLDMRLPDYDGIKVLEKIKEISPDTEVVILTAYADIKSVIEAMEKNAFSYLPKPFEIPHLISILEKAYEKQTLSLLNRDLFQKISDAKKDWETTFDSISDIISILDIDFN
ncbi:MAG: response regulator, partial [Planctomycetota bacterium]